MITKALKNKIANYIRKAKAGLVYGKYVSG